jgi:FdhD protein
MKRDDARLLPAEGVDRVDAVALRDGQACATSECVADEVPVAFEVNGIAHTVMLATPAALEDFALGFMLSEGLIDSRADLLDIDSTRSADGITLQLQVTQRCLHRFNERRRTMAGRTGCGLCGSESLSQVLRPLPRPVAAISVDASAIASAMAHIGERQALQHATGATHAAAWCGLDGGVQLLREDVGRHNALDKLIGALAGSARLSAVDPASGFIAVTSRASFEMVQKTASAGVGLLAAISAPTSLAIRIAEGAGLTLAGFVRGRNAVLYSHAGRVRYAASS